MKRWFWTVLIGLLLVPAPVLAAPAPAHACSCLFLTPPEYVEIADVVLTGTVSDIDRTRRTVEYTVEVDQVYAGTAQEVTTFTSADSGASCGLEGMEVGSAYVFFLERRDEQLTANLCGGTQPLPADPDMAQALADLDAHDPNPGGESPGDARGATVTGGALAWIAGIGAAVAVAAIAVGLVLRVLRRTGP